MMLSKSKYLNGLQCPLLLWTLFHESEKIPEISRATERIFEQGYEVGNLTRKLFQDRIDLPTEDFSENLKLTQSALKEKKPIFEAAFAINDLYARVDILVPNKKEWDIIEVKSSTEVKDINLDDVAFQKYVCESSGIKINKCYLMHLNKEYVRHDELDIDKLFVKEDITKEIDELIKDVDRKIEVMKELINDFVKPENKIGSHCSDPYECPLHEQCWSFLPENHVFQLYRGGALSLELFENGIFAIKDIPDEYKLNDKQGIQLKCEKTNKVHVNKEKIKEFLSKLKAPLCFLDFETFSTAVPRFNGLKCYSQVPFQFSLHVLDKKLEHYSFLYKGNSDPREEFILALKKVLGSNGSIIVYNQSFEVNRLKELAVVFPEHKEWVESVLKRVADLLIPFREFYYYNPKQHGSASIKNVLPCLSEKSYKGMEISHGDEASNEFFEVTYSNADLNEKKRIWNALEKYCELDTLAMVEIVEKLGAIIK